MFEKIESIPEASLLLTSLRSVGYSEEAAIADIVDNSISANATVIHIRFDWENQRIVIIDNGEGMDQAELYKNMRIGSADSKMARDKNDLGRFGMGMKTAAFSLGRKLTVITKKDSVTSNACWDLDEVKNIGWNLCIFNENELTEFKLISEKGTEIVIEKLDQIINNKNPELAKKHFFKMINNVEGHLKLVFHRYISEDGLQIYINDKKVPIIPWDPFVLSNIATQELAEETVWNDSFTASAVIQPYVLPHKTKFATDKDYTLAEGEKGWNRNQGIYLYRNRRLIIYGTWFDIIKKEPAFNLARIKIDITSESDEEWKIDIKKSSASLPPYIRETVYRSIDHCTAESANVYNSRGSYQKGPSSPNLGYVWEQRRTAGRYSYHINKKHALLNDIQKRLDDDGKEELKAYIALVENFAPFMLNGITETIGDGSEEQLDDSQHQKEVTEIEKYIHTFYSKGFSKDEIQETLLNMNNFRNLKSEIKKLLEDIK